MNILIVAMHGIYKNYTFSFVHNQAKEFVKLGNRVRVLIPLAIAKKSNEGRRFGPLVEIIKKDGVEICYMRCLSLSSFGEKHEWNVPLARIALKILHRRILDGFSPDIIQAYYFSYGGGIATWIKEKYNIPLAVTVVGLDYAIKDSPEHISATIRVCESTDVVIANSTMLQKRCQRYHSNVEMRLFGFESGNIPAQPKMDLYRIVQAGNLIPSKRNDETILAFARARERFPEMSLTIIGDGPERNRLEAMAAELNVASAVRFTGRLNNADALSEMAKARFFIMPSYPEGFGIVYLEAMACGCIAIGTETEGIADLIVSGENGFLVPRDDVDAIVRIVDWCLQNPEKANEIAERGRKTAMQHTWADSAKEYQELFQTIIDRKEV